MLAKTAVLSQLPVFVRWVHAAQSDVEAQHNRTNVYQPRFFKSDEYAIIDRVADLIIPADETPGAHDAGVAEFIDFSVASDQELQGSFRDGLEQWNAMARANFGKPFNRLLEDQQIHLLQGTVATKFFHLVREYTVMGYYTSRIGLEQLQYPGLQMYAQSPACPHKDNPEHAHLAGAEV